MTARRYVVVARSASGVRIAEDLTVQIPTATDVGQVMVRLRTRFTDEGFEAKVPRELWAEVVGDVDVPLDEAVNVFWNVANGFTPALATITNAPVDDLVVELAFDATDGEVEHEFFQNFIPSESGPPHHGRNLPAPEADVVLGAVERSPNKPRLMRALAFYAEALRNLKPGQESRFVLYLWMAVEALTKVALRTACDAEGCDENELVFRWGLAARGADAEDFAKAKRRLDGEARRRLIFHGDAACMRSTVDASDGFEHGFQDLDEVRRLAVAARDAGAAQHVRRAIFELASVDQLTIDTLTAPKYARPRAVWPFTKYFRGTLLGAPTALAAPEEHYPRIGWAPRLKAFRRADGGVYTVEFDENQTVRVGEGVGLRPEKFEVWGPENDPS